MLKDELLDVFTSFEELLFIFNLEDSFGPLLPRLSLDDWQWSQCLRMDDDVMLNLASSEFPVCFGFRKVWNWMIVLQEDLRKELFLIQKCWEEIEVFLRKALAVAGKPLSNLLDLLLACSSINGNEFSANFHFLEFGSELRGINQETFLVKSLEKTLESFSLDRTHSFISIQ